MSRNLGRTDCYFCQGEVKGTGSSHEITKENAGAYFENFRGMIVQNAECEDCLAQYLAWVNPAPKHYSGFRGSDGPFYDLSFRSSFNDEPNERDLPRYTIETKRVRSGIFTESIYFRLGPVEK